MTRNEFFEAISGETLQDRSRIVVSRTKNDLYAIQDWYKNTCDQFIEMVVTSKFVPESWYPMPETIFGEICNKIREINESGKTAVVIGTDYYATLFDRDRRMSIFVELQKCVDNEELRAIFLVQEELMAGIQDVITNPRYKEGMQLIFVDSMEADDQVAFQLPKVYLIDEKWTHLTKVYSFSRYLALCESRLITEQVKIAVSAKKNLVGFAQNIRQLLTLRDIMKEFYDVDDDGLSDKALQWIYEKESGKQDVYVKREEYDEYFGITRESICQDVLKKYHEATTIEQEVLIWVLKKCVPNGTYLRKVVEKVNEDFSSIWDCYLIPSAELLNDAKAVNFAEERKGALEKLGSDNCMAQLSQFIALNKQSQTKQVAVWLNNGTDIEKAELLRRLSEGVSEEGRKAVEKVYPEIKAYLDEDTVYSNTELHAYFREYRKQKITGKVTEDFVTQARHAIVPQEIKARDRLIQDFRKDEDTALLIVDAMGVEWLPMILVLARKRKIRVNSSQIGYVKLPTETTENKIEWPPERQLSQIKKLDNTGHWGAEAYVMKSPEENLRAEFEVINKDVFEAIVNGLNKFSKVLLTADHGLSRLAVCAWQQRLSHTLDIQGQKSENWRYMRKPKGAVKCPPELEESLSGDYWAVRGYNRLPQSGGKVFELHGGATLEERLVPVVLFERGYPLPQTATTSQVSIVEFKEDDDFADL